MSRWKLVVVMRSGPPLAMLYEEEEQALTASRLCREGEAGELVQLERDADGSTAWVDPCQVQVLLVGKDQPASDLALPQVRAAPRR